MKKYLKHICEWIDCLDESYWISTLSSYDFDEIKLLGKKRLIAGDKTYGTKTFQKSEAQIEKDKYEELADFLVYHAIWHNQWLKRK